MSWTNRELAWINREVLEPNMISFEPYTPSINVIEATNI